MATYIKSANCADGCGCQFGVTDTLTTSDVTYDWTTVTCFASDITIAVTNYADCDTGFSACGFDLANYFRIRVYADASLIYDSGCVHANLSSTVTVPADTLDLRIVVDVPCGGNCGCESGGAGDWAVDCV